MHWVFFYGVLLSLGRGGTRQGVPVFGLYDVEKNALVL